MAQILFFGSSFVQGVGDPDGGWVDRFKRELQTKMYGTREGHWHEVFNMGVVGNTSSQVLERLSAELPPRLWRGQPLVVVFGIGTDDSRAQDTSTNHISTVQEYMVNLQNMIDFTRSYTSDIMFVGLTPVDDTKTQPTFDGSYFSQIRIREFDNAMTEVARNNRIPKLELFSAMLAEQWRSTMLFDDGLHLNGMGHEWVYQRARLPLLELIKYAEQQQR